MRIADARVYNGIRQKDSCLGVTIEISKVQVGKQ